MNNSNDFDLFAAPEEDNLQEQLTKGNFEWSNKTTRILGVLVLFIATLSLGAWYGHHSATSSANAGVASLRSAFAGRSGAAGGGGGASGFAGGGAGGASGFAGGGGGAGGFGTSAAGNISKISGNTVTITVADPSSLKEGDTVTVRVRPAGAGGFPGGAPGGPSGAPSSAPTKASGSSKPSTSSTPKPSISGGAAPGATGAAGGRGGGMFSNPALTACLAKEGVTIAPGSRPDRTDPKVATALQKCFSSLGITPGGGGFGGNRAPGAGGASGGTGSTGSSGN